MTRQTEEFRQPQQRQRQRGEGVVIVGASSGIGHQVARRLIGLGYDVAVAARRVDRLEALRDLASGNQQVVVQQLDVNSDDAPQRLAAMVGQLGGMAHYVHVAGVGWRNSELQADIELRTAQTNAVGFVRMVGAAYRYMAAHGGGHITCISSIAGTKGLGAAPAYSATKALQATYIEALQQQARARRLGITLTDVRPGFVDTDLLGDGHRYPLLMSADAVASRIVDGVTGRRRRVAVAVVDGRWRVVTWLWRHLVPHWLWRRWGLGV